MIEKIECALCSRFVTEQLGPYVDICEFCVRAMERRKEASRKAIETKRRNGTLPPEARRIAPHSISVDDYDKMLARQGGVCASCGRPPRSDTRLIIDHDHRCHRSSACIKCFRGLLCTGCNTGIGHLGDTVEGLRRALAYLEAYESRGV